MEKSRQPDINIPNAFTGEFLVVVPGDPLGNILRAHVIQIIAQLLSGHAGNINIRLIFEPLCEDALVTIGGSAAQTLCSFELQAPSDGFGNNQARRSSIAAQ
jgi:hypothetical protein